MSEKPENSISLKIKMNIDESKIKIIPKELRDFEELLEKIIIMIMDKKIDHSNYAKIQEEFEVKKQNLKTEMFEETTLNKLLLVMNYFETWKSIKKINLHSTNIKSEILTMMGLFFTIFTLLQINFNFLGQFSEKYNGYRLIMFASILNIILIVAVGYIMSLIITIVYGKDKSWEKDTEIFCYRNIKLFSSPLKIKRNLVLTIGCLSLVFLLTFKAENLDKDIINKKIIDEYLEIKNKDFKLTEEQKKELIEEIEENVEYKIKNEVLERIEKIREGSKVEE